MAIKQMVRDMGRAYNTLSIPGNIAKQAGRSTGKFLAKEEIGTVKNMVNGGRKVFSNLVDKNKSYYTKPNAKQIETIKKFKPSKSSVEKSVRKTMGY